MPGRPLRALAAVLLLLVALSPMHAEVPELRIAVVLSRDVPPYREALKGFEDALRESGRPFRLHEFSADGVAAERGTLVRKVRARDPHLILTIGSAATELVSGDVTDVPIVFSMVLPSSGSRGLAELCAARPNLTGVSMEIPSKTQFVRLREILPATRRIGVLYDPAVSGLAVEEATATAAALGLELVAFPVSAETDVLTWLDGRADGVDVLWSVADSTVFSHRGLQHVLLGTLRNRIPFVGLSPAFVKAGALLAFSTDYRDLGHQAGEQSLRILAGEKSARIPMAAPRQLTLSINMNTAKQIRVSIDEDVRSAADIYF